MPNKNKDIKKQTFKTTVKRLGAYLMAYKYRVILICICMITTSICMVRGTYYLQPAIDDYIIPLIGQENPDMSGFVKVLAIMLGYYILASLAGLLQGILVARVCNGTLFNIRSEMFANMQKLPLKFFDSKANGEIISRYSGDIDALNNMIRQSLPQMVSGIVTIISILAAMIMLSWQMTIIVVVWVSFMVWFMKILTKRNSVHFSGQQKAMGDIYGYTEEIIEGHNIVRAYNYAENAKTEFATKNEELFNEAKKARTYANNIFPIASGLSNISFTILAVIGGLFVIKGIIHIGTVAAFLQYFRNFYTPVVQMSRQANNVMSAVAGAERIFKLMDEKPEEDEGKARLVKNNKDTVEWEIPNGDGTYQHAPLEGRICFDNVTFGYTEEKDILKNISLDVKPGERIAFIGSTGAGKTTIINLISRFYEIHKGTIRFDGIDVKDICKNDLRKIVSMVLQETHLFTGSVADNIRYGRLDADDASVTTASQMANADYFISHLPEGYNTKLTIDGKNLSEGQRQLLSIARAMIADAKVLILDEATSSVDTRTEMLIEKGLEKLMKDKTVFMIAHRLSTIKNADKIIVLNMGEIAEIGTHEELIEQKGIYYKLYTGDLEIS